MALEHLKDAARVIGLKQVRKAVQGGRAAAVFLDAKNVGINAFYGYGIILQI